MQRAVDFVLALLLLVMLAPLFVLTALLVAIGLGRPLLFRQRRSGRGGAQFTLAKFRTMAPGAGSDAERTPAIGRWLRRTRLDELPQLLNIVGGDMAFIGPRPLLPETVMAMGEGGRRRGAVRPGLTGWSQVNGNTRLTDADKLALDLWYIEHRTPVRDLALLLRTLGVVATGEFINLSALEQAHAGDRRRRG